MSISNKNRLSGQFLIAVCAVAAIAVVSSDSTAQTQIPSEPGDELSGEQARLADRYDRLEQIITRLAELYSSSDPNRAKLLREALAQARERDVAVRMDAVVQLLEDGRLATASRNQVELSKDLQEILELLLKENRGEELDREKKWLKKQLKEVARILRLQRGVKARTEGNDDPKRLLNDQSRVTDRTSELGDEIESEGASETTDNGKDSERSAGKRVFGEGDQGEQSDGTEDAGDNQDEGGPEGRSGSDPTEPGEGGARGEPGEGSEPGTPGTPGQGGQQSESGQPGGSSQSNPSDDGNQSPYENLRKQIRAAQENMQRAQKQLEEAKRDGATDAQEEAIRELEKAKAELERILRQLREEEMERTLALLEARFRKMLVMQLVIYERTIQLGGVPADKRNHDDEIEAGRLSRLEALMVHEVDKAIALLRDDGRSVAFPEAVLQMRDDMRQIVDRLGKMKVGAVTQGIEEDVIEALEELIAAIQQAEQDLEENRSPPGESRPPGEPRDPPLVGMLAELRMIRSLQARVKRRTERYSQMIEGAQAEQPDLIDALDRLSDRQLRIQQATHDLQTGKNQ